MTRSGRTGVGTEPDQEVCPTNPAAILLFANNRLRSPPDRPTGRPNPALSRAWPGTSAHSRFLACTRNTSNPSAGQVPAASQLAGW